MSRTSQVSTCDHVRCFGNGLHAASRIPRELLEEQGDTIRALCVPSAPAAPATPATPMKVQLTRECQQIYVL